MMPDCHPNSDMFQEPVLRITELLEKYPRTENTTKTRAELWVQYRNWRRASVSNRGLGAEPAVEYGQNHKRQQSLEPIQKQIT